MANGKAPLGENGGRKPPKTSTNVKGSGRAAPVVPKDDAGLDELFVDPAPSKANRRASERRRERGHAPASVGVPDTATSLKQEKKPSRPPTQASEINPRSMARATITCTRGPEEGLSLNRELGSEKGTAALPDELFAQQVHEHLLWLSVKRYLGNQRQGTAKVKTRGEVSGGGRKPFRQKGTGRARQGSNTSPLAVLRPAKLAP